MLKLTSVIQYVITYFKISEANNEFAASLVYNLDIKKTRILLFMMGIFEFQKENGIKLLKVSMDTQ